MHGTFTYLKGKLSGPDQDDERLQDIYIELKNNIKFSTWFASDLHLGVTADDVKDEPADAEQTRTPAEPETEEQEDPYVSGATTRLMEKGKQRLKEAVDKGHVTERKRRDEPSSSSWKPDETQIDEELEREIDSILSPKPTGKGVIAPPVKKQNVIVISPHADERLKRLLVLLGSKKSGNTADMLAEFTGILDALMKDKKIDSKVYAKFLKKFKR
jgi:hypothetical protein